MNTRPFHSLLSIAAGLVLIAAGLAGEAHAQTNRAPGRGAQPGTSAQAGGAGGGENQAEQIVRLYDLAELGEAPQILSQFTPPGQTPAQPLVRQSAIAAELIFASGNLLGLRAQAISETMFLVSGSEEQHARLSALLEQVRTASSKRYRVELVSLTVDNAATPPVGATLESYNAPGVRIDHVVQDRTGVEFRAVKELSYIGEWQPVVSNDAVGYQPMTKTVSSGLTAAVSVGGGDNEGVDVRVEGEISRATVSETQLPLAEGGGKLSIGLPTRDQRSVRSSMRVPLAQPTVVSVSSGFDDGKTLIVVVRVQPVK